MQETKNQEKVSKQEVKEKINPLAFLSYIGILCLVPLLVEKKDEFVKFHTRQGLALFICEVATLLVAWIPIFGWIVGFFAWILWIVLSVMGIINVFAGKKTPLPIVGQLADRFKI